MNPKLFNETVRIKETYGKGKKRRIQVVIAQKSSASKGTGSKPSGSSY